MQNWIKQYWKIISLHCDNTLDKPTHKMTNLTKLALKEAFEILQKCAALRDSAGNLFYPNLNRLKQEADHVFAVFKWKSEDGLEFEVSFEEGDNEIVFFHKNVLHLKAPDGRVDMFAVLDAFDINAFLVEKINNATV